MQKLIPYTAILVICFGVSLVYSAEVKEENDVLVLNKSNFNDVIKEKETLLVEFYAPWCGHCKELEPKYEAAAKQLKSQNIALAKVDATVESTLASDYGIEGFPTMKIFKKSIPGEAFDYEGPRDTEGIVQFMQAVALPSWKPPYQLSGLYELTAENITEALDKQAIWLVGYIQSDDDRALLEAVALRMKQGRERRAVGVIASAALAVSYGVIADANAATAFAVIKQGQKPTAIHFKHTVSADNLEKFYKAHSSETAPAITKFQKLSEIDSINDGIESLLLASFSKDSQVEVFFKNFLLESGFFYDRRLEGGSVGAELAKQLQLKQDVIYVRKPTKLLTPNEKQLVPFTSNNPTADELKRFYDTASMPLVGYFTWNTKDNYRTVAKPVCLFFLTVAFRGEALSSTQMWHRKFASAVKPFADTVLFAMADDEQDEEEMKSFRLDDSSADVNVGCYDAEKRRYAMPEMDSFDGEEVQQFVRKLLAGELKQTLRSVTAKAAAAGKGAAVLELTGDTFNSLVINNNNKHSIVIMCDLSVQPCAKSVQEFSAAATSGSVPSSVQFAKLNTKYNDAPGKYFYPFNPLDVEMTQPLVLLAKINQKQSPIKFDKTAVSKEYIIEFLNKNIQSDKTEL